MCPAYYREAPHRKLEATDGELDQFQFRMVEFAVSRKLPILGICRGHQLLNVYFGGSLYQDIPAQVGAAVKHRNRKPPRHKITVTPGSLMHRILDARDMDVNSFHHQSVKRLAPGFAATAHAADGVIEGIEATGDVFILGVQFHPEKLRADDPAFEAPFRRLLEEAEKRAPARTN